jgi:hypothetical protein
MLVKSTKLLLVTAALLFACSAAHAQSARQLLKKGNRLFAAGDYKRAYEAFKAGNEKRASPVFLRSMAFCQIKLYRHKTALKHLEKYLKKYKRAKDAAKLRETVTKLEQAVSTKVTITSTPAGAEVLIDSEATKPLGKTPLPEITIEPGTHTVILRKKGYATTTKTFEIEAGKSASLTIPLEVNVTIASKPAGIPIFVGSATGRPLGKTPYKGSLTAGSHKIILKADGFKAQERQLVAEPGKANVLSAAMTVGVMIKTVPPGAQISVDGRPQKAKTPTELGLEPGDRKIQLTLAGFKPIEKGVKVARGMKAGVSGEFVGGLLTMRTSMPGATVKVGAITLGKTPLPEKVSVPLGRHQVLVQHPDRSTWKKAFDFKENQLLDAKVDLGGSSWPLWTLVGVTAASLVAAVASGGYAIWHSDRENDNAKKNIDSCVTREDCSLSVQHTSTTLFAIAGAAAVGTAAYYLFGMRPSEKVTTRKVADVPPPRKLAYSRGNIPLPVPSHAK